MLNFTKNRLYMTVILFCILSEASVYAFFFQPEDFFLKAPENLMIEDASNELVQFSWNYTAASHDGFLIERKKDFTSDFSELATVGPEIRVYTDNTIEPGAIYYYRVKAYNSISESLYSNVVTGPPLMTLQVEGTHFIASDLVNASIQVSGVREFDHLHVVNNEPGYRKLKIGYEKGSIYGAKYDVVKEGNNLFEIVLKDFGGDTEWSKIEIRPNEEAQNRVVVADYLDDSDLLDGGWFKIKIPFSDFVDNGEVFSRLRYIALPHSADAGDFEIGIRNIRFTGGPEPFVWLGEEKYDNAHDGSGAGASLEAYKVYHAEGLEMAEVQVVVLGQTGGYKKSQMPYQVTFSLPPGEYRLLAKMKDLSGNLYYSDTVLLTVGAGIMAEVTDVSCHGGSDGRVDITADGLPPYSYQWSNGHEGEDLTNVSEGVYTVLVTDATGRRMSYTAQVLEPAPLEARLTSGTCSDPLQLEVSGGTVPYYYRIDNNDVQQIGDGVDREIKRHDVKMTEDMFFYDIAVDQTDNFYVVGDFLGPTTIDGQLVGETDKVGIYLASLNADGELQWVARITTAIGAYLNGAEVVADNEQNIVLALNTYAAGTLSSTTGASYYLENGSNLIKFNKFGEVLWLHPVPGDMNALDVDANNNIYMAGEFTGSISYQGYTLASNGKKDVFFSKLNKTGDVQWLEQAGGRGNDDITDLKANDNGDIIITGSFSRTADFGYQNLISQGQTDVYVAKYNASGALLWTKGAGGNSHDTGGALSFTPDNHVIVAMLSNSAVSTYDMFMLNQRAALVALLDGVNGDFQWVEPFIHWNMPYIFSGVDDLEVDDQYNIYASGGTYQTIQSGDVYGANVGSYTIKFDSAGKGALMFEEENPSYIFDRYLPLALASNGVIVGSSHVNTIFRYGQQVSQLIPNDIGSVLQVIDANDCTFNLDLQEQDAPPEICYVTVSQTAPGIEVKWQQGKADEYYKIYKEVRQQDQYEWIGNTAEGVTSFTDEEAQTGVRSYRYKISAVNSCGMETRQSEAHKSVHLLVNEGNVGQINLIWEAYEGLDYASVNIYRGESSENMRFMEELPAHISTYTDFNPSTSALYYQIEVNGNTCNPKGENSSSGRMAMDGNVVRSNIASRYGEAGKLLLYPNPAKEKASVTFSQDGTPYDLTVIDLQGRVMHYQSQVVKETVLDRKGIPAGLYIVMLRNESGKVMKGTLVFE